VQARAHIIGIDLPDRLSKGIGRPCVFELLEYLFYDALARAAQYDSATFEERLQYREAIVAHYKHIEAWAEQCPENFENRAALVGAEIARIEGRELEAQPLYEQAIRSARENGFVQNEGIANDARLQIPVARTSLWLDSGPRYAFPCLRYKHSLTVTLFIS
jgi:hypothetical protein